MHALNLWVSNLRLALERGDDNAARGAAATIKDACKSMSASFNAILDLSKFDARGIKAELSDINLGHMLQQLHAEFAPIARQKGLALRLRLSPHGPIHVRSDLVLLGRSLRNLVGNAIKYTHQGGVVLGEIVRGDKIEIAIYDSGIGIAAEHQQDIFAEFFQVANRERDQRQGLGLGLAIVRRSVETLDGHRLDFFSRAGRGSRFSITLPRVAITSEPILPLDRSPRSGRIPGSYVVVVDDEPRVLQGLVELLRNWGCLVLAYPVCCQSCNVIGEYPLKFWKRRRKTTGIHDRNLASEYLIGNKPDRQGSNVCAPRPLWCAPPGIPLARLINTALSLSAFAAATSPSSCTRFIAISRERSAIACSRCVCTCSRASTKSVQASSALASAFASSACFSARRMALSTFIEFGSELHFDFELANFPLLGNFPCFCGLGIAQGFDLLEFQTLGDVGFCFLLIQG